MLEKIARGLTRKPRIVLLAAIILLIPSALGYFATRVNYDILSYLPENLPASKGEKLLEEPFHMAATSMLIVDGMPAGYSDDLVNQIKKIPGVSNALWVSNLVGVQIPTDMIPAHFRDMFFSGGATMMVIQYEHAGASNETIRAINQIRALCNEKCFLAGFSVVTKDIQDIMDGELPVFIAIAVLLALGAMSLSLESTVLPFVLMISIGFAVMYNMGTNIFLGEISFITKAIAAVLQLGVTVDYSIFLYHRYVAERPLYQDPRDAMAQAILAAFRSLSGSSLTTIAGFLALCFMQMTLGGDLGVVMAKGVVLGVTTVVLVLPSLLLIFDKRIEKHRHKILIPKFDKINHFIIRHAALLVLFLLLTVPVALYASNQAGYFYKVDDTMPADTPSILSNRKMKEAFDMASSHFIVLRDDLTSAEMSDIEKNLENLPGITSVISYHKILGAGIPAFFIPDAVSEMLKQGGYQLMMVNSSYEAATDEVAAQLKAMSDLLTPYDSNVMITGEGAMYQGMIETSLVDIQVTNIISAAAIFLIIALTFQSFTIPAVLVAAIELAIFINQGISYFKGTDIFFLSPIIISSIQLGATVDYAILMTSRFQEELRSGKSRRESIKIAADSSDISIITSALVLFCATLGVSTVSSIGMIGAICTMLARGAVISAVICLFFLPALLYVCEPLFNKTTLHWRTAPPDKNDKKSSSSVSIQSIKPVNLIKSNKIHKKIKKIKPVSDETPIPETKPQIHNQINQINLEKTPESDINANPQEQEKKITEIITPDHDDPEPRDLPAPPA